MIASFQGCKVSAKQKHKMMLKFAVDDLSSLKLQYFLYKMMHGLWPGYTYRYFQIFGDLLIPLNYLRSLSSYGSKPGDF